MSSVSFFAPVYIRSSQNTPTGESNSDLLQPTLWEATCRHVINLTEFIFDFGSGTAYSITPQELATTRRVELLSEDQNQEDLKLLQGIMLVALVILFPLGVALLLVKSCHHNNQCFLLPTLSMNIEQSSSYQLGEDKDTSYEVVPLISDSRIARDMELTQCLLLKVGGSLFNRLESEVLDVNRAQNLQLAEALSLNLFYFKNYYQMLLKKPKFISSGQDIQEALSSLDALQKRIYINEISRALDNLVSEDSESIEGMKVPFMGINNVGNSCYIASVMQMIYSQPQLKAQLEEFDPNTIDLNSLDGQKYYAIALALQRALKAYDQGSPSPEMDGAMEEIQRTLLQYKLIEKAENPVLEIKRTIEFLTEIGTPEEDLEYMFSQLDELNECGDNWEIKAQGEPREILLNIIEILGYHCSLTETLKAVDIVALQKNVSKKEALLTIPLEENSEFSFESGLKKYFSNILIKNEEPILDFTLENGTTKKARTWYTKTFFTEAPQYLLVQLNRLLPVLDEPEYREQLCTDFIRMGDQEIDLSNCFAENRDSDSTKYRICSVIIQIGTGQQGHYVSLRRDIDGNWYKCNDSKVSQVSGQDLVHLMGAGYIYLMEKV